MALKVKYCEFNDIRKLLAEIDSPRDRAIFTVGFFRALRASEVGKLRLADYRKASGRLMVNRVKGSLSAEFPLLRVERKALDAWLRVREPGPGPLFPSRNHRPISQQMLDVLTKRYAKAAGWPREKAHWHTLRHSCAMWLLEAGRGLEEVQDWLGHRNIQNTLIYAQLSGKRRQRVVDELEVML